MWSEYIYHDKHQIQGYYMQRFLLYPNVYVIWQISTLNNPDDYRLTTVRWAEMSERE